MYRQAPTGAVVIAILHFIVGGLGLICDLFGVATLAANSSGQPAFGLPQDPQQAKMQKEMAEMMEREIPAAKPIQGAQTVLGLGFDVVLIVAGIGLLKLKPWGRTLSVGYAIVSLLAKVALAFWTIIYVVPATEKAMAVMIQTMPTNRPQDKQAQEMAASWMKGFANVGLLAGACLPFIYPFVVLLVMNTASVKTAFRDAARGDEGWEPERGGDETRPPPPPPFPESGGGPPDDRFTRR